MGGRLRHAGRAARSGPGARRSGSRAALDAGLRHEVGDERRAGIRGIGGNDEHGVLSKKRAEVGREAPGAFDQPGTRSFGIILGPKDIDRECRLALAQEHAASGRHREARKVLGRRRLNGQSRLFPVERASKWAASQLLSLPKPHKDADRAARDGFSERHLVTIAQEREREKRWGASRYLVAWFYPNICLYWVRLTCEHLAPDQAPKYWNPVAPGRWVTHVPYTALADELAALGHLLEAP